MNASPWVVEPCARGDADPKLRPAEHQFAAQPSTGPRADTAR
jgi:hypothetical protein